MKLTIQDLSYFEDTVREIVNFYKNNGISENDADNISRSICYEFRRWIICLLLKCDKER